MDSPDAGAGIFVASAGGVVARVLQPGPIAATALGRTAISQAGDVMYRTASQDAGVLRLADAG